MVKLLHPDSYMIKNQTDTRFFLVLPDAFGKWTDLGKIQATIEDHVKTNYFLEHIERISVYHDCNRMTFMVQLEEHNFLKNIEGDD
jgi:hypothetical protein